MAKKQAELKARGVYENCFVCGERTGKAGKGEDSIYLGKDVELGPLCEACDADIRSDVEADLRDEMDETLLAKDSEIAEMAAILAFVPKTKDGVYATGKVEMVYLPNGKAVSGLQIGFAWQHGQVIADCYASNEAREAAMRKDVTK